MKLKEKIKEHKEPILIILASISLLLLVAYVLEQPFM